MYVRRADRFGGGGFPLGSKHEYHNISMSNVCRVWGKMLLV